MSSFVEVRCLGDARAFIEAGSIVAIVTSPNGRVDVAATPESPMQIIMRNGIEILAYGECPGVLMVRAGLIRQHVKEQGKMFACDFLERSLIEGSGGIDDTLIPPG